MGASSFQYKFKSICQILCCPPPEKARGVAYLRVGMLTLTREPCPVALSVLVKHYLWQHSYRFFSVSLFVCFPLIGVQKLVAERRLQGVSAG